MKKVKPRDMFFNLINKEALCGDNVDGAVAYISHQWMLPRH